MKKIVSLVLVAMLILSYAALAETAEKINLIPKVEAEAGYVYHNEDGSLHISGRQPDGSGDAYTDTWLITQEKYADFTLEFDYTPTLTGWNWDRVSFRCTGDENGWNQYMLVIRGLEFGEGKAGFTIMKGEASEDLPPIGYYFYDELEAGITFNFKLVVKDHDVKLYFGEDGVLGEEPVIDTTLPDSTDDYRNIFIPEGDFQIITWAGDFTMTYFDLIPQ